VLWIIGGAAGALAGRRAHPYYYLQLVPSLALAAGIGLAFLIRPTRPARWLAAARIAAATTAVLAVGSIFPLLTMDPEAQAAWLYNGNSFSQAAEVARWLRMRLPPEARFFNAGSEPEIAFLSGRRQAGRQLFVSHLFAKGANLSVEREAWLAELERPDVSAVVFSRAPQSWGDLVVSTHDVFAAQHRIRRRLADGDWRLAAEAPPFEIYLRRNESGRAR
jgi:hypothetical protein